jgi:hypothetical protein
VFTKSESNARKKENTESLYSEIKGMKIYQTEIIELKNTITKLRNSIESSVAD